MIERIIELLGGEMGIFILGAVYVAFVVGERGWAWARGAQYDDADARCSVGLNLMASLVGMAVAVLVPLAFYLLIYDSYRLFTVESLWLVIPIAFLVHEMAYYWDHRLSHRVGLLWAFHSIHHSSNRFNHTTAARTFYLDAQLQGLFGLAAAFIGIHPAVYIAVVLAKAAFGIWNHASYVGDLGWMERWFATPRNHMVHHANQPQYIDRNYSQVLLWDRMFGTFEPYDETPELGLITRVHDNNPLTAQFAGIGQLRERMARAERWQDRLGYLWRPPEWTHDGACSDCPKYAALAA